VKQRSYGLVQTVRLAASCSSRLDHDERRLWWGARSDVTKGLWIFGWVLAAVKGCFFNDRNCGSGVGERRLRMTEVELRSTGQPRAAVPTLVVPGH